jgi:hypothetical protein
MPKDALGHGSDTRGGPVAAHAAAIHALPGRGGLSDDQAAANNAKTEAGMSDATYHAQMPPENFTGQVQDLLGLWDGSQKPSPLSDSEKQQVNDAYAKRGDWRSVAANLRMGRKGIAV